MASTSFRTSAWATAFLVFLPLAALASPKPFTGPPGWDLVAGAAATPQSTRAIETWKKSDGGFLTYLSDAGLSYDETLALVKKNVTDNGFKTSVDAERKCDGRRAHEVEMTFGTTVVRQVIVDDAPGVTKLTYTRPQGTPPAADVAGAINAYCGPAQ
jgi:hypothetical protein